MANKWSNILGRKPAEHAPFRKIWSERANQVARVLGRPELPAPATDQAFATALASLVDLTSASEVWLALSAITGRLPVAQSVTDIVRASRTDQTALFEAIKRETTEVSAGRQVDIETEKVVVDLNHTVATILTTGIQRVARETVSRWLKDYDNIRLVGWEGSGKTWGFDVIRDLGPDEIDRIKNRLPAKNEGDRDEVHTVVVPWNTNFVVPELPADPERTWRIEPLALYGHNKYALIGFDLIPWTSAETVTLGMSENFGDYLTSVRYAKVVAAISDAANAEFTGWTKMLAPTGITGPKVVTVFLPAEAPDTTPQALATGREVLTMPDLPTIYVVGSHEPRKGHLGILHAAERLWDEGHRFAITFAGGSSWGSSGFKEELERIQDRGYPVTSITRVSDDLIWGGYRTARFTVFTSLNEGFGLPVAESLAVGTPVITSNFGSMAEIARDGGCLTVDPRDDETIVDAMRELLTNDETLERLRAEARARRPRTWDDYARETWQALVTDVNNEPPAASSGSA